jgi:hypothetical protein
MQKKGKEKLGRREFHRLESVLFKESNTFTISGRNKNLVSGVRKEPTHRRIELKKKTVLSC